LLFFFFSCFIISTVLCQSVMVPEPDTEGVDIGGTADLSQGLIFIACFVALIIILSITLVVALRFIEKKSTPYTPY